jgi:hypothetical protein
MALEMLRNRVDRSGRAETSTESTWSPRPWRPGTRPRLRLIKGEADRTPEERRVVAEILSDGTIRGLSGSKAWDTKSQPDWRQGSVAGDGWTMWWERRPWIERSA